MGCEGWRGLLLLTVFSLLATPTHLATPIHLARLRRAAQHEGANFDPIPRGVASTHFLATGSPFSG